MRKLTYEDLENIETTDNYGNTDIGFTVEGTRYVILNVKYTENDLDECGDDFKPEFYDWVLANYKIEKIEDL